MKILFTVLVVSLAMTINSSVGESAIRHVHDPAIIKQGKEYYLFSTGSGIPIRRSADLVNWLRLGRVFPDRLPDWAADAITGARGLWAPDISFYNGLYHLYYSVSTFGSQRSCIGLAVNKTLDPNSPDYSWKDMGMVVESFPDKNDFNAIDADITLDEAGKPWLSFGSFWGGIKLIRLDPKTGKQSPDDKTIYSIAARPVEKAIEGPCIMPRGGWYYLFVSFDFCCRGADSDYKIMVGRSKSITGPYLDRGGRDMREGGGTLLLASDDRWKGPGHNEIFSDGGLDYLVHHAYDPLDHGIPTLLIRPLAWDSEGWPLPGPPL
jgi:arabinan endo-1,5-alpha-L-arabinosidase